MKTITHTDAKTSNVNITQMIKKKKRNYKKLCKNCCLAFQPKKKMAPPIDQ